MAKFNKVMTAIYSGQMDTPEIEKYLQSTGLTDGKLWQSVIQAKITEGAEPVKCMRNALKMYQMKSKVETRTVEEAGSYLEEIAEGAEIPEYTGTYSTVTFTARKWGKRNFISSELVNDSDFDVIGNTIAAASRQAENQLNRIALLELLEDAGLEHDTTGTAQGEAALSAAIKLIKDADFMPDTLIVGPAMEKALRTDFKSGAFATGDEIRVKGYIGHLYGCDVYSTNVSTGNATYVWGDTDSNFMGVVFDSSTVEIGMLQDTTHNAWDDNNRDLKALSVLARFDVEVLHPNGVCRIEA